MLAAAGSNWLGSPQHVAAGVALALGVTLVNTSALVGALIGAGLGAAAVDRRRRLLLTASSR